MVKLPLNNLLDQGWATSSVGGPYVGRQRSSRAGLVMSKKKKRSSRPEVDPEEFGEEGMKF